MARLYANENFALLVVLELRRLEHVRPPLIPKT